FEGILRTIEPRVHAQCHQNLKALAGGAAHRERPDPSGHTKRAAGREMTSFVWQASPALARQHDHCARKVDGRPCRDASRWDVRASLPTLRGTPATSEAVAAV